MSSSWQERGEDSLGAAGGEGAAGDARSRYSTRSRAKHRRPTSGPPGHSPSEVRRSLWYPRTRGSTSRQRWQPPDPVPAPAPEEAPDPTPEPAPEAAAEPVAAPIAPDAETVAGDGHGPGLNSYPSEHDGSSSWWERPEVVLGAAFAGGLLLAALIRRRRS